MVFFHDIINFHNCLLEMFVFIYCFKIITNVVPVDTRGCFSVFCLRYLKFSLKKDNIFNYQHQHNSTPHINRDRMVIYWYMYTSKVSHVSHRLPMFV